MADNFNLRSFLIENKLTKNAKLLKEAVEVDGKEVDIDSMEIDGIDMNDFPDFVDAFAVAASFTDGTDLTDDQLEILSTQHSDIIQNSIHDRQLYLEGKKQASSGDMAYTEKAEEEVSEGDWRNNPYTPHNFDGVAAEAKKHKHLMKIANELFPQYGGNLENFKPLSPLEREQVYRQYTADTKVIPFKESKLTAKERRLVEMVQNALGIAPQAVAEEAPMAEDEMVQENPLPKYKNIDELMSNIEHGTNEAAHKYKMERMKEVAEALEAKVSSLEEGENAEHIDQKAVKQMRKDILALRKGEEKLRKEFEKKFAAKKEKKEDK